jgi:hypothetical protein
MPRDGKAFEASHFPSPAVLAFATDCGHIEAFLDDCARWGPYSTLA